MEILIDKFLNKMELVGVEVGVGDFFIFLNLKKNFINKNFFFFHFQKVKYKSGVD